MAGAQEHLARPRITGIAHVRILVTDLPRAREFYERALRLSSASHGCGTSIAACLIVNDHQQLQLVAAPSPAPANLVTQVAFATTDVVQLRRYLVSKGLAPNPISVDADHQQFFTLPDPEGHVISFVRVRASNALHQTSSQIGARLIHVGFIVRDRQVEDAFYQNILDFRLYWHGGMRDGETSWVSMQVPDGTDWLEYMLNISPGASHHTVGVMNHIALGVTDMQAAKEQLLRNGGKPGEAPKIGRDGKWQLNLYDPDETRVELMEFRPVEKPCCSEFTGPHPTP